MKFSKHKLSTPDLELLITNLKAFIVKVGGDEENQEYDMDDYYGCVYAKTMSDSWSPDKVSQLLIGREYHDYLDMPFKYTHSKLYTLVHTLFTINFFTDELYYTDDYGNRRVTKQQWLEVANKVVLKLEKKLWKRKDKENIVLLESGVCHMGYGVYGQRQSVGTHHHIGVGVCYNYDDTKPLKPRVTINK